MRRPRSTHRLLHRPRYVPIIRIPVSILRTLYMKGINLKSYRFYEFSFLFPFRKICPPSRGKRAAHMTREERSVGNEDSHRAARKSLAIGGKFAYDSDVNNLKVMQSTHRRALSGETRSEGLEKLRKGVALRLRPASFFRRNADDFRGWRTTFGDWRGLREEKARVVGHLGTCCPGIGCSERIRPGGTREKEDGT